MNQKAVVLHSGGQDSTTCLAWAIDRWGEDNVYPLIVNYGQRHHVEIDQARIIVAALMPGRQAKEIDLKVLSQLGSAALTNDSIDVNVDATGTGNVYAADHGLPSTFVPGRNLLFLTAAAAYGAHRGAYNLVTGVCAADEAGYPDCRPEFIEAASFAIATALDEASINIEAPLIERTKADTFELAADLGVLDLVLEDTHTCYHGDRSTRWSWGYGCGKCGACDERANGWAEYVRTHPSSIA